MKKIIYLFVFAFIQNTYGQDKGLQELTISMSSAYYYKEKFGSTNLRLDPKELKYERLNDIVVCVFIDGFDVDNPINFNAFSLVETDLKFRLRPNDITYRQFQIEKFDLKDHPDDDAFLKYSREGITNNDYYYPKFNVWKGSLERQERFYIFNLPPKKNKKKLFWLTFSVKDEDNGEYSLYYKDQLIKAFVLKRGETLKF